MIARASLVLACVLAGCGAGPAQPPPPPVAVPAAREPVAPQRAEPPAVDARATAEAEVARALDERFDRTIEGSTVEIAFERSALGERIDEIVVERGYGHGFSLQLFRLRRSAERPDVFEVHGLAYATGRGSYTEMTYELADRVEVLRMRGEVPSSEIDALVPRLRAAIEVRAREVEPPPEPNGSRSVRMSGSSADRHVMVELASADGHRATRRHTGYLGSSGQEEHLPMTIALELLDPLLDRFEPAAAPALEDTDRALFAERWRAARPHFQDEFAWWVRERYVAMASRAGTAELVPDLLAVLQENAPARGDREPRTGRLRLRAGSEDRTRVNAVNALAAITGRDLRNDARRAPRPIDEVAAAYLRELRASDAR